MTDLSFPFRAGEGGVPATTTDIVEIAGDMLRLALRTERRELPGFVEFGGETTNLPFENNDEGLKALVRSMVADIARRWLPTLVLSNVTIEAAGSAANAVIEYDVGGIPGRMIVAMPFMGKPAADVRIVVSNVAGQIVRSWTQLVGSAGMQLAVWDGTNDNGIRAGSGTYLYRVVPLGAGGRSIVASGFLTLAR